MENAKMDFIKDARGLRNNNPGNIRATTVDWQGEVKGTDSSFETFEAVEFGIRAIFKLMGTYYKKHGCINIRDMVNRWAPPVENDTKKYILSVLHYMSNFSDAARKEVNVRGENTDPIKANLMPEFVAAIIFHENGFQPFNKEFIEACGLL